MKLPTGIYGGTPIPQDRPGYAVVTRGGYGREDWFAVRCKDAKAMTQGSVVQCSRWVSVWGPMYDAGAMP